MKIGSVDTANKVLIIAEIGNNHEGSIDVALELIKRAADAGVRAVKFQTFRTEHYVSANQAERFARLKRFELSRNAFLRLAEEARRHHLLFISTPFDIESAEFLDGIVDGLKIASGDNTFYPLIEKVAESGKPLIISTGLATMANVRYAAGVIERAWDRAGVRTRELGILHCVSAYPVPPEEANLAAIRTLQENFPVTVGYSDHTLGIEAAMLAVAAGARIVEKHFTLDRNYSDFRDHQLSADPQMLAELVKSVERAEAFLGHGRKEPGSAELEGMEATRRSIASAVALPAGTILGPAHITWIRPGNGIPPGEERRVLGRRLRNALPAGTVINEADLD